MNYKELLRETAMTAPLLLLKLKNKEDIDYCNNFLPYSTGFEIECNMLGYEELVKKALDANKWNDPKLRDFVSQHRREFLAIPNIMHVSNDASEQRYRIPNGINGLICLYLISHNLKKFSELNDASGIHYHIDFTDVPEWDDDYNIYKSLLASNHDYVLTELETWGYKGTYNSKGIAGIGSEGNWVRQNDGTVEFRIGEMTFDYEVLVKRIVHLNEICRNLKGQLNLEPTYSEVVNAKESIKMYESLDLNLGRLAKLEEELREMEMIKAVPTTEEMLKTIKKRIYKI